MRDGVGRKLLVAEGVEDGESELIALRDVWRGDEAQDALEVEDKMEILISLEKDD